MKVKRIVPNIPAQDPPAAKRFYEECLGLQCLMDHGWILTYGNAETGGVQVSIASQGGSDTATPDLSVEVDDVDEALRRMQQAGFPVLYGPFDEPWGVRRFYVRDPFGRIVNILSHLRNEQRDGG